MLGNGVGYMLDAGATGICGGLMSLRWQHGGLENWSIGGSAQGRILATCTVGRQQ